MSDRDINPASRAEDDDDLAYLDAGLSNDDQQPTMPFDDGAVQRVPPPRAAVVAPEVVERPTEPAISQSDGGGVGGGGAAEAAVIHQRDSSWTWPLINLVGLLVVIAVNYAANYFEFNNQSTGDVVNKNPVPFQPAGWVFSIWGVIYLLLIGFVVYGLLPAGRHNQRLQRISPLFLISNIANAAWIFFWHWEQFAASMGVILLLLASLVAIYLGVRARNPFRRRTGVSTPGPGRMEMLFLRLPFSIYLGWIMVASLSNLMVWFDRTGRDSGVFSQNWWAIILMGAGTLVAALFMATARDGLIAAVMAVAFAGIAQHNWGESTMVSIAAIVFTVIAAGVAGMAFILAFDRDTNRSPFGRSSETGKPIA